VSRAYRLGRREHSTAATRQRILDVATELMTASGFHPVAIDDIAAQAGTSRPTVYRHFGSKVGLFEAVAWNVLSAAGIARLDEARELTDPVVALREFLRANCRMFAAMGTRLTAALDVARHEPDIAQILEVTYYGRRIDSLQQLTARLVNAGRIKPEWTHDEVVDALLVLTNVETFQSLNQHRARSWQQVADRLFDMTTAFRTADRPNLAHTTQTTIASSRERRRSGDIG
jgi:AcrR family transcriptional regulator